MPPHVREELDPSLTWSDFSWLVENTKLPVVAKGILTPEDATLAVKHGAKAILVSAHGGRQLDGVPDPVSCYLKCTSINYYDAIISLTQRASLI